MDMMEYALRNLGPTLPDEPSSSMELVESMKSLCLSAATGGVQDDGRYKTYRKSLIHDATVQEVLPAWIRSNRTVHEFWEFIKERFSTYSQRREFLRESFDPVLSKLEIQNDGPADAAITDAFKAHNCESVISAWQKALDRRTVDPEGAITAARSLLESVCKHILEGPGSDIEIEDDLPKLYAQVAAELNLAPSMHTEDAFRRILGSVHSIVDNVANIRNRIGDAHGKGKLAVKPSERHAKLVVNLAGTVAVFLVETYENQLLASN